mgnify:CR=1 FL=1
MTIFPSRDSRGTYICHYPLDFKRFFFFFHFFFFHKTDLECITKIGAHSFCYLLQRKSCLTKTTFFMLSKRQKKWSHNATTHVIPCDSFGLENHASMIFWCQNCSPRVVLQLVLNLLSFLASVSHTSLCITNQLFLMTRFEGMSVSSFNTLLFVHDSLVLQNLTLMTLAFRIFPKVTPIFFSFFYFFFFSFFSFFHFFFFLKRHPFGFSLNEQILSTTFINSRICFKK